DCGYARDPSCRNRQGQTEPARRPWGSLRDDPEPLPRARPPRQDRRGREGAMTETCEVAWFSALCDDDYEFLGSPDPRLAASFEHCRDIVLGAETGGFDNILLPSGYALGIDTLAFAAAVAPLTRRIRLLVATRIGEMWPPQLARQLATLD